MEIHDRPGVRLRLKVRLLKAEVVETLLHGCMTWSPNKPDCDRLRRVHHSKIKNFKMPNITGMTRATTEVYRFLTKMVC